jgi:hypothetical protein
MARALCEASEENLTRFRDREVLDRIGVRRSGAEFQIPAREVFVGEKDSARNPGNDYCT